MFLPFFCLSFSWLSWILFLDSDEVLPTRQLVLQSALRRLVLQSEDPKCQAGRVAASWQRLVNGVELAQPGALWGPKLGNCEVRFLLDATSSNLTSVSQSFLNHEF